MDTTKKYGKSLTIIPSPHGHIIIVAPTNWWGRLGPITQLDFEFKSKSSTVSSSQPPATIAKSLSLGPY